MADESLSTMQLRGWIDRLQAGDAAAREDLLRYSQDRLERLAHKMLRQFPKVGRWVDSEDVLQNALLRLLRALEEVNPGSVREFFALAATQIRRELLDLARHYYGKLGLGANHATWPPPDDPEHAPIDPPDVTEDHEDLDRWYEFHQYVEKLDPMEREVVGLIFYHGCTQNDVASLLKISPRSVRRHWASAMEKIGKLLRDPKSEPPQ